MTERRKTPKRYLDSGIATAFGSIPRQFPKNSVPARQDRVNGNMESEPERSPHPISHEHEIKGLYIISVAARLLEMHPQTLRKYERVGLVSPSRTIGMLRLYSERDIIRLRLIKYLVDDLRINLAGVEFALGVLNRISQIRYHLDSLDIRHDLQEELANNLSELMEILDIPNRNTNDQR
jgi:MerR family transcriptional regulator/heat shock protein HspR